MTNRKSILLALLAALALVAGCSHEPQMTSPGDHSGYSAKNGTEVLGPPSISIAAGTGFAEGGVGMVGAASGQLTVAVPAGAQVVQALLYWAGGSTTGAGDGEISLDGTLIQGELIGGPVLFFGSYEFFAYRADITGLGLVGAGTNTFTVADFDFTGTTLDENNGASLLVIFDDGTARSLTLRDGLDMAYFGFEPTLDATVPQVFSVDPGAVDRSADLVILAASVGQDRPNTILVSTSEGDQVFEDLLGSFDGLTWDSLVLPVNVPAGVEELSVQLVSTPSTDPRGASLGWVAAGLALEPAAVDSFDVSGAVFVDADDDGAFGAIESGIGAVVVELIDGEGGVAATTTAFDGRYLFRVPAGSYTINLNLADYPDDFNADLASSFDATTVLSLPVVVGPDSAGNDFGFKPRAEQLANDLTSGTLSSNGLPVEYWTKLFRRALIEEDSNRQAVGHDSNSSSGSGWGHGEDYMSGAELVALTQVIEGLYLHYPYQFTDGGELREVYDILRSNPRTDEEKLFRELLVTELNFAAGRGIITQSDVVGVLISWGEALLAGGDKSLDKGRSGDITYALTLFEAINTGGGGGVDE